ncbi:MAG: ECF-type sigma factor [Acidobacteriota bacterium]
MDETLTAGPRTGLSDALGGADPCRLLRRCLGQRRELDWRHFVGRYGRQIVALFAETARRLGLSLPADELEELAQDLYVSFLLHDGHGFEGREERQFWRFLRRCVRHSLIDRVRHEQTIKRRGGLLRTRVESSETPPWPLLDRRDPERRALQREDLDQFLERCRRYGDGEGRVLGLVFVVGLTSREVSHVLDGEWAPKQVDNLVERFRRRARRDGVRLPRRCPGPERLPVADGIERSPSCSRC